MSDHYRSKDAATQAAKATLARMKTKGWRVRVHENMGWYWSLLNGPVMVTNSLVHNRFYAMVSPDVKCGGSGLSAWTDTSGTFTDPNAAVDDAVKRAKQYVNGLLLAANWMDGRKTK